MSSTFKLKNDLQTEFTIVHEDGKPAKTLKTSELTIAKETVQDMEATPTPSDGDVCIVKAPGAGGIYVYDTSTWNARITW